MNDTLSSMLNSAGRVPLLTADEEIHLGRRVQAMIQLQQDKPNGPYTMEERRVLRRGKQAKDRMVTANLRLVATICRRFQRTLPGLDVTFEDMMQDGILGLMRGVEKFDPSRGYKLSTYIYWWIRQGINRGVHQNARTIRLPVHVAEKMMHATHVQQRLRNELKRDPTTVEIAEALGVAEAEYRRFLLIGSKTASLDCIAGDEGSAIGDLMTDGSTRDSQLDDLSTVIDHERVRHIINTILTDKQRMVVLMHYGIGMEPKTWREIGKAMGVHHEACRCNHDRAMRRIKRELLLTQQIEKPLYKTWSLTAA